MDTEASNERIKEAIRRDDPVALELMWNAHAESLYAVALAVVCQKADAEEVVQDLFVKVARIRLRLLSARDLTAYLHRMARNGAIDYVRRRARGDLPADPDGLGLEPVEEPCERPDLARAVSLALAALPLEQREVITLKFFKNMTFLEVAEALGVSPNTAASRCRYGLERLRRAMKEAMHECEA